MGKRHRLLCAIILICIFQIFSQHAVEADANSSSGAVHITAQKSGHYDPDTQMFVGEGGVELQFGDTVIHSDYVEWDIRKEELYMAGSVELNQNGDKFFGEALWYNVAKETGRFVEVRSDLKVANAEGPVFLFADEMELLPDRHKLASSKFTTCDLPDSHYHLATKEVEVVLGEKMVIRGVTYYEGTIPLFYWPYIVIPLDTDLDNQFAMPVVGYSEEEGFYAKNTFNYYFSRKAYGSIFLDVFSRLGVGYGARHNYDLGTLGSGVISAYQIPHAEKGVVRASLDHEWTSGPWELTTRNSLEDTPDRRMIDSGTRLTLDTSNIDAHVEAHYQENAGTKTGTYWGYGGAWNQKLTDNWRLRLDGSVTGRERTERLRMVDYLAETSYVLGNHTWALAVEQQYNPDLYDEESSVKPSWSSVNRIPELSWQIRNMKLGDRTLPMRLELTAGQYQEFPSETKGLRGQGNVNLLTRYWRPTDSTTLSYSGDITGSLYEQEQYQLSAYGRLNLTQRLTDNTSLTGRYTQREVWGESPFRFDQEKEARSLSLQLNYSTTPLSVSLRSGYDFVREKYDTLIGQARWQPNEQVGLSVYASYDLNTQTPDRLVPLIEYQSGADQEQKTSIKLGGRYHIDDAYWERVDIKLDVPVGETWTVGYDAVYRPDKAEFSRGTLRVSKDMHCRSLTLSYDHVRKDIAVSLTINAFPTLPLQWGSSTGVSLFDLSDVYDIIGIEE